MGQGLDVLIKGHYLYFGHSDGMRVLNKSNPAAPVQTAELSGLGRIEEIKPFGDYLLLAKYGNGVGILNASNPAAPVKVGEFDTPGAVFDVAVRDHYLLAADETNGLVVLDIANPAQPVQSDSFRTESSALFLAQKEHYLFLGTDNHGMRVLDITNPTQVREVGSLNTQGWPREMVIEDTLLYIAGYSGSLEVVTIKDPLHPQKLGYYRTGGYGYGLALQDGIVWLADWYDGVYALRFDATQPSLVSEKQIKSATEFSLEQNYPNPFNASTRIDYTLAQQSDVKLTIHDPLGRIVKRMAYARQAAGRHQWRWDGTDGRGCPLSSGLYFCRIAANGCEQTIRMMLIK